MDLRRRPCRTGTRTPLLLAAVAVLAAGCTSANGEAAAAPSAGAEGPAAGDAIAEEAPTAVPSPTTAMADAAEPREMAAVTDLPANAAALDFTARRLSGGTIDGVQLAGGDVALWMWAPWCPQCNREAPHVAEAIAAWDDRVTFVGMAGHDDDEAHRAFVTEHGLDGMVHLVDDDGSLWAQYGVGYQPAWVLVDDDGTTQLVAGGLYEDLDARLRALVDG